MAEKNITRIGIDVDDKLLEKVDNLKDKEKWSRRQVAYEALRYYLKLRGYQI